MDRMTKKNDSSKSGKTVKAKTARKASKPKAIGLIGYQAAFVGGTKLVVDKVLSWIKTDKVKELLLPIGHFPYVGGQVVEAAAKAGVEVTLVSATKTGWENFRDETKLRLEALFALDNVKFHGLNIEDADLKNAEVYRAVAKFIAKYVRSNSPDESKQGYVVALTNTPRTMDDARVVFAEGCVVRPLFLRKLREMIEKAKAEYEASVAEKLDASGL